MSSHWKIVPTFGLADQLSRDMYEDMGIHRFFNDQYMDGTFHAWPWTAHSGLRRSLGGNFDEVYRRHWDGFTRDLLDNYGVRILCDRHGTPTETERTAEATGVGDKALAISRPEHGFKVALDLSGFTPEEISVKIVDNNTLRVAAKHEEQTQGRSVQRSYTREFTLPTDVNLEALKSSLDAGGVLSLKAPGRGEAERAVPIEHVAAGEKSSEALKDAPKDDKK
ncbi:heat shock protein Hsp-16.1/Hsp-16.11-like [Acanthaster planci]|uniref:Heat shock protein Hsp-16.1/Hsp-16.11-like n=1 Tax=Acanthaster planci TaxID=133434 RepID=A0A8B7XVB8_ACAPL|nr:heat shock protein Hsp-16.1/Hsp-16.11-like [Acanthaster planci]